MGKLAKLLLGLGIVAAVVLAVVAFRRGWQEPTIPPAEEPPQLESWRQTFSETDLDLLARVVRAEAEGEPYDGQVAVAAVILNRVKHPEFPNTIPGVVYEPLAFSVVANGEVNKPANASAVQAAHAALNGWDPTGGALYFYNPSKTRSAWIRSRPVLKTIGGHIFAG